MFISRYGVCYVFNFVTKQSLNETLKVTADGPDYGLSLMIDIERDFYMRNGLSPTEGVYLVLAAPGDMPNILASPIQIGITCTIWITGSIHIEFDSSIKH